MADVVCSGGTESISSSSGRSIEVTRVDSQGCQGAEVEVTAPQKSHGDEAVVVWDAALVLAHFLELHQLDLDLGSGIHVVDVGAGTGAVGLVASALGANVTLTDLGRIVPLLDEGLRLNPHLPAGTGFLRTLELTWGNTEDLAAVCQPPPDLIVVSDCVYYEASLAPLVFTLRHLSKVNSAPILVSYELRDYSSAKKQIKEQFFALVERYFDVKEFDTRDCHPTYSSEDIKVIKLTLK